MPHQEPAAAQRNLPLQTRLAPIAGVDAEKRTFRVCWTTGAQVRRFDWASWTYYLEELVVEPDAVDMRRFETGLSVLNTHQQWDLSSVLGIAQRGWLENGQGMADCLFSDRDDEVNAYWRDVVTGIIRNVSVGYIVRRYEKTDPAKDGGLPVWRAIEWEPAELSFVPVNADPFSGSRSLGVDGAGLDRQALERAALQAVGGRTFPCEFVEHHRSILVPASAVASRSQASTTAAPAATPQPLQQELTMDENEVQARGTTSTAAAAGNPAPATTTTAAPQQQRSEAQIRADEQARIAGIRNAVALARRTTQGVTGLDQAFEDGLVARNLTLDQARSEIFQRLEQHSSTAAPTRSAAALETLHDEQQQRRADMAAALAHRANPGANQLPESARRYRGYTLFELARRSLEDHGVKTEGMSRNTIVSLAMGNSDEMGFRSMHGTADFSIALASTVNRTLRQGYESAQRTFTRWARPGTLSDFRAATRVAVAGNLKLEKVNEFGEFKRGKLVDGGENIQLGTYGKIVGVTRQTVINDDLDFLSRLPMMYGRAAADFESDTVYSIITANAAMADGVALFHANHGNLGTAGAPSETTLTEARAALRKQTDPSGNKQPLNLVGRYILVPAALETTAQKLFTAVVVATKTADTNVFQNSYEIVCEPRLDASSTTAWYLVADNAQIDTVEYAYLEGEQGLYTEQRMGFDVDGLEVKARLDFAAKAIDHRGLFKNAG